MKNGYTKKALIAFCAIALLAGCSVAYALTSYTYNLNWSYTEPVKSINISPSDTTISFGEIVGPTTKTATFTVTNDGTVSCTVNAVLTVSGLATGSLDKSSVTLAPSESATFTATVVITGAGSASVTFTAT